MLRYSLIPTILTTALCAFLVMAHPVQAGTTSCFPASQWGSAQGRPCYKVRTPAEDGSGWLHITGPRYRVVCAIPNPTEERHTFKIICHRIGGRK